MKKFPQYQSDLEENLKQILYKYKYEKLCVTLGPLKYYLFLDKSLFPITIKNAMFFFTKLMFCVNVLCKTFNYFCSPVGKI